MALQPYENFKGVTNWQQDGINENIQYGLLAWSRWAMLNVGGFQNVSYAQASGLYGGHTSILRPVKDPNFTNGQVWESIRGDWVWETGISYSVTPTVCSGVYVNNSFKNTSTEIGAYAHYVDYTRGRVIFDSAISTSSDVRADYAFRIPTINYSKTKYMQELLYGSLDVYRSDFNIAASGSHSQLSEARRQLPTVGLELTDRRQYRPYQIGGGQIVYQDVFFYVFAEYRDERDKLINIFANQNDKVIYIPDIYLMKSSAQYPVDIDLQGKPVSSPKQYPEIVSATGDGGYRWTSIMLRNAGSQTLESTNDWLYGGTVRMTCEAIFENL